MTAELDTALQGVMDAVDRLGALFTHLSASGVVATSSLRKISRQLRRYNNHLYAHRINEWRRRNRKRGRLAK